MKTKSVTNLSEAIALMLAAAAALVGSCVMAAPMHWVYEAVDPAKCSAEYGAALDAQDHAHVVYGRDSLYYDWEEAGGWHSEVVDTTAAPEGIAMVLDDSGRPHAVYVDMRSYTLKYARKNSSGWSIETITQDDGLPQNGEGILAIDLDSAGWPHVGYVAGSYQNLELKHVFKDASGWHASTVGSWGQTRLMRLIMVVADDDQPHLACMVGGAIFHGWREPWGWQSATIGVVPEGHYSPLRFDAAGRLHWVYCDQNYRETYLMGTREQFVTETIRQNNHTTCELAVSPSGVPHVLLGNIGYWRGLQYWSKPGGVWTQTIVDTNEIHGALLVLDAADRPHVLYQVRLSSSSNNTVVSKSAWLDTQGWHPQDEPSGLPKFVGTIDLMLTRDSQPRLAQTSITPYAYYTPPGTVFYWRDATAWQQRVLASPPCPVYNIDLGLDPHGKAQVASGSKYAWRDSEGWRMMSMPGSVGALALESNGHPHILVRSTNGIEYAVLRETGWEFSLIDTNRVYEWDLALDGMGTPHMLVRQYLSATATKRLAHIWQHDSGWLQETVVTPLNFDINEGVWFYPKIAVDTAGTVHICYFDLRGSNKLKYGYKTAQGWQLSTVDANGTYVGAFCSMDLDDQNQPHIVYASWTPDQLRYARKAAAGWQIRTVDSGGEMDFNNANASLCLGPDGTPHITYRHNRYGTGEEIFRYARLAPSGWEIVDLERGGALSSLVVDQQGRPHIAYSNWIGRQNLSYIYVPPFALTGIMPISAAQVRLQWQGALEGVGVDRASTPGGPWSPVAENLAGLECTVEAPPPIGFFRLRHASN